jgi:REP element-mobilizing transposase RayT
LAQIYLHVVFSTKHRTPWLRDKPLREALHSYLGGICRDLNTPAVQVGGIEDHVHILCRLHRTVAVADLLQSLKRSSSLWIKEKDKELADFHWQDGYGVFSISPGHVEAVRVYVANQEAHHASESFQDEYRRLLEKYGIEYDERYVWD